MKRFKWFFIVMTWCYQKQFHSETWGHLYITQTIEVLILETSSWDLRYGIYEWMKCGVFLFVVWLDVLCIVHFRVLTVSCRQCIRNCFAIWLKSSDFYSLESSPLHSLSLDCFIRSSKKTVLIHLRQTLHHLLLQLYFRSTL